MFCPQCGASNADSAAVCVQCGRILQAAVPAAPIKTPGVVLPPGAAIQNYLVFAILSTVLCCPATGIPAIIYAAQVNGKIQAGDLAGAKVASDNAKMWCWISVGVTLAGLAIWLVLAMIGIIGSMHHN